jgi:hypothetical protein
MYCGDIEELFLSHMEQFEEMVESSNDGNEDEDVV